MKIILIRHGQAEDYKHPDSERQLTELGQAQAIETATYIMGKYQPDHFVVSPYVRAQQTLKAFTDLAPEVEVSVHDNITPSDDAKEALTGLADVTAECLVVVCHMSIIAKLASLLTGEPPESFALAEARVLETEFVMADMAKECDRFVPNQAN